VAHPNALPVDPSDADAWRAWADAELAPMGLSVVVLHQAAEAGQRALDATSPLAPKIKGGLDRWSDTVVALRVLTGWELDEAGGLPRIVHPSGDFYAVVRTGANGVGVFGQCPIAKNGLGALLQRAIDGEPTTVPLFDASGEAIDGENYEEPTLWLFLTEFRDGLIYSELSQPASRVGDEITGYVRQIQLPPFEYGQFDGVDDDDFDNGPDTHGPQIDIQPI